MATKSLPGKKAMLALLLAGVFVLLTVYFRKELWALAQYLVDVLADRERVSAFISRFGAGAPLIFILLQILQVLLAPIPGEASGFIGGYLFGALQGFVYSSIGLGLGSIVNFGVGRFLGERYIRKLLPSRVLERFESLLKRHGVIVLLVLFIFPGFPKDYLCLFLGITAIPFRMFIMIAAIGRLPGTFVWSLQGEFAYGQHYGLLALVLLPFIGLGLLAYRYRENLYRWVAKMNGNQTADRSPSDTPAS